MLNVTDVRFDKLDGLVPVCVQHARSLELLMLGFMNEAALRQTLETGVVTFYSRSKARLWTKGETSGHYLNVKSIFLDCDQDTLLIKAEPQGPTCHTGASNCFSATSPLTGFMHMLMKIDARMADPREGSYTAELMHEGVSRMAQKVGEEGVEVALAAVTRDDAGLLEEAADLLFHLCVLLRAKGLRFEDVSEVLGRR